jgi:hypothetical protein
MRFLHDPDGRSARRFALLLTGFLVAVLGTPSQASEKWGPFRGRLVDQDTGQGIAGAAVIVIWWKNEPNPIQMNRSFFDAIEAVTDAEGRFVIPRYPNPPFFDFQIFPPEITYFAPGYLTVRHDVTPPDGPPFVAPTLVLMERFDPNDPAHKLILAFRSRPNGVPLRKMKEFTRVVNIERAMRGLQPLPVPGIDFIPRDDD